jgi:hypothetical protein
MGKNRAAVARGHDLPMTEPERQGQTNGTVTCLISMRTRGKQSGNRDAARCIGAEGHRRNGQWRASAAIGVCDEYFRGVGILETESVRRELVALSERRSEDSTVAGQQSRDRGSHRGQQGVGEAA